MIKIVRERENFRTANQRIRRARRLYVFLNRFQLNHLRDPYMDYMVGRMRERGLYSDRVPERNTRQGIQSTLYRIERKEDRRGGFGWHEWCFEKGWNAWTGYSQPIMMKQA